VLLLRLPSTRVRGFTRYSFLTERGQRTFAHDARGREIWGGHWSPNLITDVGMDALHNERTHDYPTTGGVSAQTFRSTLRLGNDSTEPAFTNTVLGSELLTTTSNGGFGNVSTFPDPVGSTITANYRVTRVATVTDAANFTEYGFSGLTSNLNIRELFRDEEGDPITISISAGKKLRVDHTLAVTIPWGVTEHTFDIEEYDAGNALIATHAMVADCLFVATASSERARMFRTALPVSDTVSIDRKSGGAYLTAGSTNPLSAHPSGALEVLGTFAAYTAGSFTRRMSFTMTEAQANGSLHGFVTRGVTFGSTSPNNHGYRVVFKSPATFTKLDTHTFTFAFDWSWARG
jgi:hypothetical protein